MSVLPRPWMDRLVASGPQGARAALIIRERGERITALDHRVAELKAQIVERDARFAAAAIQAGGEAVIERLERAIRDQALVIERLRRKVAELETLPRTGRAA